MKRLIIRLSCVLLLMAATLTVAFANTGSVELTASAPTVEAGQTVEITATLSDFPQVKGIGVIVTMPDGMTVESGQWLVASTMEQFNIGNNQGVWAKDTPQDFSEDTQVFKLVCKMNEPAVGQQDLRNTVQIKFNVSNAANIKQTVNADVTVSVVKSATSLELNKQTLTLELNAGEQLVATYGPENTTQTLSWISNNEAVATVAADGTVTAVAEGEAEITATVGSLTKTCVVTVACTHQNKTEHEAAEPTCQATGNNLYYTCDACGDAFAADGTETTVAEQTLATVDCTGGTATCTQKALCKWCGEEYGEREDHVFTQQIEDADHQVPGSGANCQSLKEYYYDCENCTTISDTERFASQTYGEHVMDTAWTTENEKHFHKCTVTGCTYKEDEAACAGGTATCTAEAVCVDCQQKYGEKLPHSFSEKLTDANHQVPGSGANCQSLKEYYYDCVDCIAISDTLTYDVQTYGEHVMDTAWTTENEKHFHKCTVTGCTHKADEANCSGGAATCTAKAVCADCQQEYGSVLPHSFTEKLTDADHQVPGSGANCQNLKLYYYDCAGCSAVSDTLTYDVQTYGEHVMDTAWTTENEKHFHKCTVTGCTHKADEAACGGGTATCTAKAVCADCQQEYGSILPHSFTEKLTDADHQVPGSGANCQSLKEYYYDCAGCSAVSDTLTYDVQTYGEHVMDTAWTTENEKHFHKCTVTGCTHKADEAACGGGTATCTAKAVCADCQQQYGSTKPHNYSQQWLSTGLLDTDQHYRLCDDCELARTDAQNHSFGWITDDPATEDKTGLKHEECSVCKVKRNEGTVIEKLDHTHVGIQRHDAVAATCVSTGNVEYWTCSSSKCTGKYYGDADCYQEISSVEVQINADNHVSTTVKNAAPASCYQPGYTGDTHCAAEACGKLLQTGTAIEPTGIHVAGTQWFSDGEKHWHTCTTTGCSAKVEESAHSYSWVVDDPATEDKTGIKHEQCVCGAKRNEDTVIEKLPHVHVGITRVSAVKATCTKEGNVEYWTCSSSKCTGKYYGDAGCQVELTSIVQSVDENNHAGGVTLKDALAATCSKEGYTGDEWCNGCSQMSKKGAVIPATGKHTAKAGYEKDADNHWQICADCGTVANFRKEGHTYKWVTDVKATEQAEGSKHQECTVCGYTCNAGTVVDKLEHKPTRVDGKAATCTEDGVIEHFRCKNCGVYYASQDGKQGEKIAKKDIVLPATGHTFETKWTVDAEGHWHVCACGEVADKAAHITQVVGAKDATEVVAGYTGDTVCEICEYVVAQGQEIPMLQTEPTTPDEQEEEKPAQSNLAAVVIAVAAAVAVAGGGAVLVIKKRKVK